MEWFIIPRFCQFCSLLEDGIFSRMTSETLASWKTVLPRCHVFPNRGHLGKQYSQDATFSAPRTGGILENSTPKMPRFLNSHMNGKPTKPGYNVKNPPFSSGSLGKMQSSGLQNCPRTSTAAQSTVLGQFWRPLDCIFPRIPRKKVESWPKLVSGEIEFLFASFIVRSSSFWST